MNWISSILERPVAVTMFFVAVIIIGLASCYLIPIELSPNIELPMLTVRTRWHNTSAVTIEAQVTAPIESTIQRLKGVERIVSRTREGGCSVTAWFAQDSNLRLAELELSEKISQLKRKLPKDVSWPIINRSVPEELRDLEGFIQLRLIANRDIAEIRRFAEEKLRIPLSSVSGIDQVDIRGGKEQRIRIDLDPAAIQRLGIKKTALSYLKDHLVIKNGSLGNIMQRSLLGTIKLSSDFQNIAEIKRIPIQRNSSGRIIRLEDIASVRLDYAEPRSIVRINGKNTIVINLMKEQGINLFDVAQQVDRKIAFLKQQLPVNMELIKELDKSRDLKEELNKLGGRSLFSLLFIAVVLVVVFSSLQTAFIIICSIFFSVLGAVSTLYFLGYNVNILTLSGFTVGFGILVDNAIVVYDNICRRMDSIESASFQLKEKLRETISSGTREMVQPLMASNLTTLGAFLPIFILSPELQVYFKPFVIALGLTLVISLLVSFTLIPSLVYREKLRNGITKNHNPESFLIGVYKHLLSFCILHKKWVVLIVVWLFGFPIWLLPNKIDLPEDKKEADKSREIETRKVYEALLDKGIVQKETGIKTKYASNVDFMNSEAWIEFGVQQYNRWWGHEKFTKNVKPALFEILGGISYRFFKYVYIGEAPWKSDKVYLLVSIETPNNFGIEKINQICLELEDLLSSYSDQIEKVTANIFHKRRARIRIDIDETYENTDFSLDLYNKVIDYGNNIGGVEISVRGYGESFHVSLASRPYRNFLKVKGYNFSDVHDIAQEIGEQLKKNRRIQDVNIDMNSRWEQKQYEMILSPDQARLALFRWNNLNFMDDAQSVMGTSFSQQIRIDQKTVRASLNFSGTDRVSVQSVKDQVLESDDYARYIRVSDLSEISKKQVLPMIQRENQSYIRMINFNYIGPDGYAEKMINFFLERTKLPYGYSLTKNVKYGDIESEQSDLICVILLGIVCVWMITAALFESFSKPFLVLIAIPLSFIGLFTSFYFFEAIFDKGGYASVLWLAGITVNNAILLVRHISVALKKKRESKKNIIIEAAAQRVRPIFITTTTTLVGFLPLVIYETTESAWYPFAIGAIGGLAISSVLILIVLPVLFRTRT